METGWTGKMMDNKKAQWIWAYKEERFYFLSLKPNI